MDPVEMNFVHPFSKHIAIMLRCSHDGSQFFLSIDKLHLILQALLNPPLAAPLSGASIQELKHCIEPSWLDLLHACLLACSLLCPCCGSSGGFRSCWQTSPTTATKRTYVLRLYQHSLSVSEQSSTFCGGLCMALGCLFLKGEL